MIVLHEGIEFQQIVQARVRTFLWWILRFYQKSNRHKMANSRPPAFLFSHLHCVFLEIPRAAGKRNCLPITPTPNTIYIYAYIIQYKKPSHFILFTIGSCVWQMSWITGSNSIGSKVPLRSTSRASNCSKHAFAGAQADSTFSHYTAPSWYWSLKKTTRTGSASTSARE